MIKMTPEMQIAAEKKINDILYEGQQGKLTKERLRGKELAEKVRPPHHEEYNNSKQTKQELIADV